MFLCEFCLVNPFRQFLKPILKWHTCHTPGSLDVLHCREVLDRRELCCAQGNRGSTRGGAWGLQSRDTFCKWCFPPFLMDFIVTLFYSVTSRNSLSSFLKSP